MSGRLDQSLDSIIDSQKKSKRPQARRQKPKSGPIGGVKKTIKPNKSAVKPSAAPASRAPKNSKIIVSQLPLDVTENQIKEYFGKSVGPIKKVSLHYNQHGHSRGIADIIFVRQESAALAAKEQNGIKIDGKPMKVEVIIDASLAPEPKQAKSLAERVAANPKAQPKSATATKATAKDKKKDAKGKPAKKTKNARPKPKTAEELDAEMTDYWAGGAGGASADAAAPTSGAPAADAMEEEIS